MDLNQKKHEDELEGASVMNKDIVAAAAKKIAEKDTERRTNEAAELLQINDYRQKRETIDLRHARAVEEAKSKFLKELTALNTKFMEGDADTSFHKKEMKKAEEIRDKAIREADSKKDEELNSLRQLNPTGYLACRWD